jgi:hypothetical protein
MIENFYYWLHSILGVPVYFYCRYESDVSLWRGTETGRLSLGWNKPGCLCFMQETKHPNWHDSPTGHPACEHCTYVPTVRCGVCKVEYFDSVAPNPEVWVFSLWRGWRHVACQ